MLFDLRVAGAACLAVLFFVAVGLGLVAMRSPIRASGYAIKDGPALAGPGLPKSQTLPLPVVENPEAGSAETRSVETGGREEITGSIATAPEAADPLPRAAPLPEPRPHAKPRRKVLHPAKKTINTLIEQNAAPHDAANVQPAAHPAKAAVRKRRIRHAKQPPGKQAPQSSNPFAAFMNNNTGNKPTATR